MAVPADLEMPRRISWAQHRAWLDHHWQAGQHVSIVAVTGGGKSYLFREGLSALWADYRVLVIDVKGDDPTLAGFGRPVHEFPAEEKGGRGPQDDQPRIYRLVVPEWQYTPGKRDTAGLRRAQEVAGTALDRAYRQGDWLIYCDETRALTDSATQFGLGLRGVLENVWQRGRSRRVTLVAATQQPLWMPSSFYSQPSLLYIARMLEPPTGHLREIGGDTALMKAVLPKLGQHEFLVVERDTGRLAITKVGR